MAAKRVVPRRVQHLSFTARIGTALHFATTRQSIGFIMINSETRKTQKVSYRNDELGLTESGLDVREIRGEEVGKQGGLSQQSDPFAVINVNAFVF